MALLESVQAPQDVRRLTRDQLQPLADEVRRRLIDVVSQTAGHSGRDIIMVLNDNGMSIAPNVGAINKYLGSIIASPMTVRVRERVKGLIESVSHIVGGQKLVDFAKTMEESVKNLWSPGMLFQELGFPYFWPIDGHNIAQMVQTFEIVKTLNGPRVVHVITEKGKGFPLPQPDTEKYHARAPYDPVTGELRPVKAGPPHCATRL